MLSCVAKFLKTRKDIALLLPENVHPEQTIYYNGAFVLQAIKQFRSMELLNLYLETQKHKDMTMPVFLLCLDWLFLLNLVSINDQGKVELCS